MKKTFFAAWVSCASLVAVIFAFLPLLLSEVRAGDQVRVTGGMPGWHELGTTVVRFTADHDEIHVAGNDWYNHLKFRVIDAAVEMINMTVVYENGAPDVIPLAFVIPKGAESRLIDLRGGERRIRSVQFTYKSGVPGFRGRSKIILFGLK